MVSHPCDRNQSQGWGTEDIEGSLLEFHLVDFELELAWFTDANESDSDIQRIGGRVVNKIEKKKVGGKPVEVEREEKLGGILHWGRESSPDLQFFRDGIRKAYGGRAPRVLDPFAGGGAIPLEAMRLGCEVTAIDINPVAWFILKCTLEYPQKLAGQKRPLPDFVLRDREFIEEFFKAQGLKGATLRTQIERLGPGSECLSPAGEVGAKRRVRDLSSENQNPLAFYRGQSERIQASRYSA